MRKALIVGIDNYTQCPLHGCCNDAEHMAQELSCNGDGSPNFSVKLQKKCLDQSTLEKTN